MSVAGNGRVFGFQFDTPDGLRYLGEGVWIYSASDDAGLWAELEIIVRTDGTAELVSSGAPRVNIDVLVWLTLMIAHCEDPTGGSADE